MTLRIPDTPSCFKRRKLTWFHCCVAAVADYIATLPLPCLEGIKLYHSLDAKPVSSVQSFPHYLGNAINHALVTNDLESVHLCIHSGNTNRFSLQKASSAIQGQQRAVAMVASLSIE